MTPEWLQGRMSMPEYDPRVAPIETFSIMQKLVELWRAARDMRDDPIIYYLDPRVLKALDDLENA